jgi:hypothetical protein
MGADLNSADHVRVGAADAPDTKSAALAFLRRGWSVVPIRPRAKLPLIAWEQYQHRRADEDEIAEWFQRWPNANIGIVTGNVSHLVVLDIDPVHGGADSLAQLEAANGPLPATVEAETGGSGRHLYYLAPPMALRSRAGLARGIDLRAEGGLVVAPPSIHPSGKAYVWRAGHDPQTFAPALLPQWIERLAHTDWEMRGHPVRYWRDLLRTGVEEGLRNTTIASLAGHLLWHGVDPEVVIELLLCWNRARCRPPLEDEEVVCAASSIIRLHQHGDRG